MIRLEIEFRHHQSLQGAYIINAYSTLLHPKANAKIITRDFEVALVV